MTNQFKKRLIRKVNKPTYQPKHIKNNKDEKIVKQKKDFNKSKQVKHIKNPSADGEKKSDVPALHPNTLRIVPLGGCEEVGRNMTVFEYNNDIVIVDMGLEFPQEDTPGIDYIIPNTDYLKGKEKNIRGVIFTHGHLDHTGASPILLEKLNNPLIIGAKLTVHMIKGRVEDYKPGMARNLKTKIISSTDGILKLGSFKVKFFPVEHNIIDSIGVILETPVATAIHPGDWKIEHDKTKVSFDYNKLAKLKKPTILMLESLGVSYKNPPVPESEMYKNIEKIIATAPGRVIIGTFSSNIDRIRVVLEMAQKYNKKVAVDGFSMKTNIKIAKELGYIKFNLKNLLDVKQITKLKDNEIIVMCTGAQGEENAVMSRIANKEHRFIKFQKTDTVIFSSSVIPGNERTVQKLKDLIYRQSDNVIHSQIMDVHSGGHATANDVEEMIRQIKPTYFMPVYANHFMLKEAAKLARKLGYNDKNILIPDNGSVIDFGKHNVKMLDKKAVADPVFVDGLGVSDLQNIVLRDRQILADDGMVVVIATIGSRHGKLIHNPDIISRGFVYLKENKELISDTRKKVSKIVESFEGQAPIQANYIKNKIRNNIGQFLFQKTGKRPMVLPVVIEV
ncbi:ribonuclease J [Candidatus Parcubacteria bacterium]|nr:ribonuclease J [Patescibacteria group bacterium]MBU4481899.1 ribonuclease J [Patescibacteria group bacterium]MCG2686620.1 ribonuclease J [Candidatus Parcubacteria bacterium]